jgi:hypothetical protein
MARIQNFLFLYRWRKDFSFKCSSSLVGLREIMPAREKSVEDNGTILLLSRFWSGRRRGIGLSTGFITSIQ